MNKSRRVWIAVMLGILVGGGVGAALIYGWLLPESGPEPEIEVTDPARSAVTSYEECVNIGGVLLLSLPSKCMTARGKIFTNPAGITDQAAYDCSKERGGTEDGKMEIVIVCKP